MKYKIKLFLFILILFQSKLILSQNLNFEESNLNSLPEFIFNDVKDSIVRVSVTIQDNSNSVFNSKKELGVGIIYNADGLIIINSYALRKYTSDFEITFTNGKSLPAKLVSVDSKKNIAILKTSTIINNKPVSIPYNTKLSIGNFLILITDNRKETTQNTLTLISKININEEIYPQIENSPRESLLISSRTRITPDPGLLFNTRGEFIGFSYIYFVDDIYTNKFAIAFYILDLKSIINEIKVKDE